MFDHAQNVKHHLVSFKTCFVLVLVVSVVRLSTVHEASEQAGNLCVYNDLYVMCHLLSDMCCLSDIKS